jgi:cellulose synthase/poly-beta-1,6-N-acetylglucosamine synthase-like glycosyltransferase
VAIVIAARDESGVVSDLLASLDSLDYPSDRLCTVVVDDGSVDSTGEQLAGWSQSRRGTYVVTLPHPIGKAAALNAGIAAADPADVIVICDADLRPYPGSLRELVMPFADPSVGAVSGYMRPVNALASAVARYAAVETWMTQLVTSSGKDRLGLNPPTLGFCAFRLSAFEQIGGLPPDAVGEDLVATVLLTQTGWETRFVPEAIADNRVVHRLGDYWAQHARWAGNTFDAGRIGGWKQGSVARRAEVWMMSAGYADRLALLAAAMLSAAGTLPFWVPLGYLGLRGVEVGVALAKGRVRWQFPVFLFWAVVFFAVDILATVWATGCYLRKRSATWRSPARGPELPRTTGVLLGDDQHPPEPSPSG